MVQGEGAGKALSPIEKGEGSYTVQLDIGSVQPAYCEVVPDGFDMADMIRRSLDLTMPQVEKSRARSNCEVSNPSTPAPGAVRPIYRHSGSIA